LTPRAEDHSHDSILVVELIADQREHRILPQAGATSSRMNNYAGTLDETLDAIQENSPIRYALAQSQYPLSAVR
jgi:hypothetical protein